MLTRPNVSEPFQIAAIRVSPGSSDPPLCAWKQFKCRLWKTNFVMPRDAKKPR
jgi:hypothetical protein